MSDKDLYGLVARHPIWNSEDSPYVFGDEPPTPARHDPEGRDVVIIDGKAMTYRHHRTQTGT